MESPLPDLEDRLKEEAKKARPIKSLHPSLKPVVSALSPHSRLPRAFRLEWQPAASGTCRTWCALAFTHHHEKECLLLLERSSSTVCLCHKVAVFVIGQPSKQRQMRWSFSLCRGQQTCTFAAPFSRLRTGAVLKCYRTAGTGASRAHMRCPTDCSRLPCPLSKA